MRLSGLLLLSLASSALSKSLPRRQQSSWSKLSATRSTPAMNPTADLDKRQVQGAGQLLGLTTCVRLGADLQLGLGVLGGLFGLDQLLGLGVNEQLCICVAGGVITPSSLAQITAALQNRTRVNLLLLGFLSVDAAADAVVKALVLILGRPQYADQCGFPAHSIPDACGTCSFTCATGYIRCRNQCVLPGFCASGIPITGGGGSASRRGVTGVDISADLLCPKGFSACGIAAPGKGGKLLLRGRHECIDTTSNVETCGGCVVPLSGAAQGVDCTAIPFADAVSCVSGRCVVQSCEKGYKAVGHTCLEIKVDTPALSLDGNPESQAIEAAGDNLLQNLRTSKTSLKNRDATKLNSTREGGLRGSSPEPN